MTTLPLPLLLVLPWVTLAADLGTFHESVPGLVHGLHLERGLVTPRPAPETVTAEVESLLEPPQDVAPAADADADRVKDAQRHRHMGSHQPDKHVKREGEEEHADRGNGYAEGGHERREEDRDAEEEEHEEEEGGPVDGEGHKGGEEDVAWAGRRPLDGTDWPKWAGGDGPHGSTPPRYSGGGVVGGLADGEQLPDEDRHQRQAPSAAHHQGGPWVQQWLARGGTAAAAAGDGGKAAEAAGAARAAAAEAARRAAHRSSFRRGWRGAGSRDTAHDESWGRRREYNYGLGGGVAGGDRSADLVAGGGVFLWQPWGPWHRDLLYL